MVVFSSPWSHFSPEWWQQELRPGGEEELTGAVPSSDEIVPVDQKLTGFETVDQNRTGAELVEPGQLPAAPGGGGTSPF